MRVLRWVVALGLCTTVATTSHAQVGEPACVETPRPDPSNPVLTLERDTFGFHDEELVLCSPGFQRSTHLTARLWVPKGCELPGSCPGVLHVHGFGFTKETTVADMNNSVAKKLVALTYDIRGHGGSGDQVGLMGREEIADEAAVLAWFVKNVQPTKIAVEGISQGGSHSWMAAIFNCGSERAAFVNDPDYDFNPNTPLPPCDQGRRWVDAIAPIQGPTTLESDGTCTTFAAEAIPESRGNLEIAHNLAQCIAFDTPAEDAVGQATGALPSFDFKVREYLSRADQIDVPVYAVTGFFDRLVLPQNTTEMYELLRARVNDPQDTYKEDLRLTISNDGHGAVGGNFAVLNDVFDWIDAQLRDSPAPLREAPVAIAQEWQGNEFRLESDWPIPGTQPRTFYLSRTASDAEANGSLSESAPASSQPTDEMKNLPVPSSPPQVPFTDFVNQITASTSATGIPFLRLDYLTEEMPETIEITDLPSVSICLSSSSEDGQGQLHVALAEVGADGTVTEFARNRRGVHDLGPTPKPVSFELTVSSHRIDAHNRLLLTITPTDPGGALPFPTLDSTFVHHDPDCLSTLTVPAVDPDRTLVPGPVPSGPAFPQNAIGALCNAFHLPCPEM